MHIVAIAWIFVVVLMTAAEATSSQGSLLGAFFTLLLYGALPLGIVLYVMGTPARRRARRLAEQALPNEGESGTQGDGSGHAAGATVTPEREKP